jgi:hypothetical protein
MNAQEREALNKTKAPVFIEYSPIELLEMGVLEFWALFPDGVVDARVLASSFRWQGNISRFALLLLGEEASEIIQSWTAGGTEMGGAPALLRAEKFVELYNARVGGVDEIQKTKLRC